MSKILQIFIISILYFILINCEFQKLPSFLKICSQSDPNFDYCMLQSVEKLRPRFRDGIPEMSIPRMEPLFIQQINIDKNSGPIFIHSTYTDINIYGLSDFKLHDIHTDLDKVEILLQLEFPSVNISAKYAIDGKLMLMPLKGEGNLSGQFNDLAVFTVLQGEKYTKINENNDITEHIKIMNVMIEYKMGESKIHLDNLFNGEPTLGATMNALINENLNSVATEVKPVLQDAMTKIIQSATDKFFEKFSFGQLFPE